MKKLSFFLMAMILSFAPALRAADVTETIAMKKFGGLSTSAYENVTKTGTSDKGTEMVAYAFNPTTGQVRGSKTTIAGASITSKDDSKNWSLYNTQAMPGAIKKITVTQTATGSNYFRNNLYVALGTTNQGAVTTVTGAQKNTTGTATEFTFVIDETQGYTYFKLLSNEKFTSGSVAGVVVTVTYAEAASNPDAVKYTVTAKVNDPAMGTVSGAGEYEEGKTATLTANANAGYKFVNWSTGSTANPLKITVTEDVEVTANFEAIPTMTCAEAAAAAKDAIVVLNPFDVVYVVKGAGYTYIKDDSGVNLIFDYTMDDQFKAGDHVEGFVGVSSPYNGLPEIKPTVSFADLKVTPGTAPEATVFETVPTKEDVNKYVVFKGVKLTSNISYNTSSATNATISVGGKNVTLRNTFKLAASLTSGSTYDIYAFVAIYNGNIQMYYASSVDVSPERTITATVNPAETGTVTGAGTYKEGKTATLKATPTEGYAFTCWTEGEDTVSTAANYSFKVAADRSLVANFIKKTISYELNGGAFPEVKVPTNEELALVFKQEYAEYFAIEGLTDTDMKREVGNFIYVTNSKGGDAVKFITENANWKWLHDYILTVAGNIPEGTNVGFYWRANLDGFFHCKNAVAVGGVASADYTEAGKPEAWGAAYQAAHAVVLPTEPVDAPYTLPTPVKEGYKFVGWYDNAEGTGEAYTVIPAGWSGTLYAIWEAEGPATALENIAIEGKVVKTIINGQLIIIKNGVQYNAQGAVVK